MCHCLSSFWWNEGTRVQDRANSKNRWKGFFEPRNAFFDKKLGSCLCRRHCVAAISLSFSSSSAVLLFFQPTSWKCRFSSKQHFWTFLNNDFGAEWLNAWWRRLVFYFIIVIIITYYTALVGFVMVIKYTPLLLLLTYNLLLLFMETVYKEMLSVHYHEELWSNSWAAAIAPWFLLRLPSCGRGFESLAHHRSFYNKNCDLTHKESTLCGVAAEQLVERSLPIWLIRGSSPYISMNTIGRYFQ